MRKELLSHLHLENIASEKDKPCLHSDSFSVQLREAVIFAAEAHKGQVRYGTDIPYIVHPFRVALRVATTQVAEGLVVDRNTAVVAAVLHDVLEDCDIDHGLFIERFGERVTGIVKELTQNRVLPREERRRLMVEGCKTMSLEARFVKLADREDNLRDMKPFSKNMQEFYYRETGLILKSLSGICPEIERSIMEENKQFLTMKWVLTNFGPTYPLSIGGGSLSNIDLLKILVTLGYKVLNIGFFEDDTLSYKDIFSEAKKLKMVKGKIENYLLHNQIHCVNKSRKGYLDELVSLSMENNNYLILRPYGFYKDDNIGDWNDRILFWNNDFDIERAEDVVEIIKKQRGEIAVISEMLANRMWDRYNIKCDIIRSAIDWGNINMSPKTTLRDNEKLVLGLPNPNKFKCDTLPFKLIEGLPEYQFLAVTSWGWDAVSLGEMKKEKNVKVLSNLLDVSSFYRDIDILLVPTILPESYPRFIQEALFLRIPIVASAIGNLPKLIGNCGVAVNSDHIDEWRVAIKIASSKSLSIREAGRKRIISFQRDVSKKIIEYFSPRVNFKDG